MYVLPTCTSVDALRVSTLCLKLQKSRYITRDLCSVTLNSELRIKPDIKNHKLRQAGLRHTRFEGIVPDYPFSPSFHPDNEEKCPSLGIGYVKLCLD